MTISLKQITTAAAAFTLAIGLISPVQAVEKKEFKIAWTIYAGWMPWAYAQQTGIVKKWADKYGISVNFVQVNDYVESINQYTAGKFDGVTITNMDALTIPAAGGVDTTVVLVGDYSNGNDGIVLKTGKTLTDIKGQRVNLVELSVSHYLLARALESVNLSEKDIKTDNTSDADIFAAANSADVTAVVTWNPQLADVKGAPGRTLVFDSTKTPGEILDLTAVNTQTLKDNPALGKALAGAWFEILALMHKDDEASRAARTEMAKLSGTDLANYDAQLKTTFLYWEPAAALAYTRSPDLIKTMELIRTFSFDHGLLGEGAKTKDAVGIAFPGGKTLGNAANVKLRFDDTFESLAAEGKL
jgi:NitT/TauT family transport system substrate-binding protein